MKTLEQSASVQRFKLAAIAFTALLSGACATTGSGPTPTEQLVTERLDSYIVTEGEIRHDIRDPEVARLWQESAILGRSGDLDAAMSRLQQAISITPRDPVLWSRAAEFELDQNAFLRAENYAAKSNSLATLGNRPLRYRNWLIIKRSREGRGDLLGAREAELESTKLAER